MKFAIAILGVCIAILLISALGTSSKEQKKQLKKMDYHSLQWGVSSTHAIRPEELIKDCKIMGATTHIYSKDYLRSTEEFLGTELLPFTEYRQEFLDARTVGILHWNDGSSDTMIFNNFDFFQYRDRLYHLDSLFLEHVLDGLPHRDAKAIKWLEPFWKD